MKVVKFGGTSVANAINIQKAVSIVKNSGEPQVVVVSAFSKVTDLLIHAGTLAEQNNEANNLEALVGNHVWRRVGNHVQQAILAQKQNNAIHMPMVVHI